MKKKCMHWWDLNPAYSEKNVFLTFLFQSLHVQTDKCKHIRYNTKKKTFPITAKVWFPVPLP